MNYLLKKLGTLPTFNGFFGINRDYYSFKQRFDHVQAILNGKYGIQGAESGTVVWDTAFEEISVSVGENAKAKYCGYQLPYS